VLHCKKAPIIGAFLLVDILAKTRSFSFTKETKVTTFLCRQKSGGKKTADTAKSEGIYRSLGSIATEA
jgi:hypothetical protein